MDAATLVDNLIQHTQNLMQDHVQHLVAFSGGVDSSLVLTLLKHALSSYQHVQPVLGILPAVPIEQIQFSKASELTYGIRFERG